MINIFDNYDQKTLDLHESLKKSGYDNRTIVLTYNGFLPENVESPYGYFINKGKTVEDPLFFNRLLIPEFYEIHATNSSAEIRDFNEVRARINYIEPKHKRCVHFVEWLDSKGKLRCIDHYDKFGYRYAETVYNLNGELVNTAYFDKDNKEVIVENYVTKDIILNINNEIKIFESKREFINYYLELIDVKNKRYLYNTLSESFFLAISRVNCSEDILVWQEGIGTELPGNMNYLLNNKKINKILVPNKQVYNNIIAIAPEDKKEVFVSTGYVYDFTRENNYKNNVLIMTNSDQIEKIETILSSVSEAHFHIVAITEMSSKLTSLLNKYTNLTLHQNASTKKIDNLFTTCDFYLDINHYAELLDSVRRAFDNNMLILAFNNTAHNRDFTSEENIHNNVESLVITLKTSLQKEDYLNNLLNKQRSHANCVEKVFL